MAERMISAAKLVTVLARKFRNKGMIHYDDLMAVIADVPSVEAVEVVRCKDCKHWKKCESSLIGETMCCTGQGSANILKAPTDFCSYGERREGE